MDTKIVYIDGVDWQHEVGEIDTVVWPSKESILEYTDCAETCGVVQCKITFLKWAHPQNLVGNDSTQLSTEKRITIWEKKIIKYTNLINNLQRLIDKEREPK